MPEVDEGLKFDEETHTYTVGGEVLPSVTQILKAARLIDYSMIPQPILQAAARRGRAVHQVLELLDNDLLDPASEIDAEIAGYVGAAIQFYRDTQFEPHLVEFRNYHRTYRYAGTLDRTGIMAGRQRTIVDFKTGIILPCINIRVPASAKTSRSSFQHYRAGDSINRMATTTARRPGGYFDRTATTAGAGINVAGTRAPVTGRRYRLLFSGWRRTTRDQSIARGSRSGVRASRAQSLRCA